MIKVGFKNTKQVLSDLSRFENCLTGEMVQHFNKAIPKSFYDTNKRLFKSEGKTGDHGNWKPLNEDYAAWKAKKFPGKTIMRRTDRGYKSLTGHTGDSIKFIGNIPGGRFAIRMGTAIDYMEYWQKGVMTKKRGKITRRTIDPQEMIMVSWLKIIHRAYVYACRYGPWKKGWKINPPKWDELKKEWVK